MTRRRRDKAAELIIRPLFYPTLAWSLMQNRLRGSWRWWDRVDPWLLLGALPGAGLAPELAREGVRGVINTCAEYAGPVEAYRRAGIEQLHLPTTDFMSPTLEQVEQALAFIARHADASEQVYLHCKAGRGRSATIALCWLVHRYRMPAEEAQRLMLRVRPRVHSRLYLRPVVREIARRAGV